jgi:UDP-N-acetylmuramate dehydrogenase
VTILEDVSLAEYTTLGVGGPARWFVEARTEDEIIEAVGFARERGAALFVLGGGSNLLVSDAGFAGVVVRVAVRGVTEREETGGEVVWLTAGAGERWDDVVRYAVDRGYAGIECLAGIPGDVGGTPVQNVGAYGQEVAETIVRVRAYDLETGSFVDLEREACKFSYRRSVFNSEAQGRYVVSAVTYDLDMDGVPTLKYVDLQRRFAAELAAGELPTLRAVYEAVRAIRVTKGMLAGQGEEDSRSAGSFFKNPVVPAGMVERLAAAAGCAVDEAPKFPAGMEGMVKVPAAWLMERAGFYKGFAMGRVGLSSKHVLAIVNRGGATAAEIVALRDAVVGEVRARFGITLEQEPVMLGFPPAG